MIVPPRIYLQSACLKHRFVRAKDTSDVYERPERIRAVNRGIAALHARLEEADLSSASKQSRTTQQLGSTIPPFTIIDSAARVDMREHPGSLAVHSGSDPDGQEWSLVDDIDEWCVRSLLQIQQNGSEIPEKYEQDLYLCPESLQAFEGALGTVCEAVDHVCLATGVAQDTSWSSQVQQDVGTPSPRVFVAVRPPGHHCGEDTPAGFGFVNNVCVGAFHAFEQHRLGRIVIFDFDLHHGNGTQEIVRGFQSPSIFYGSMHDIKSYPCEAGNAELIEDASLQLHGVNGEWIHNVHLLPYKTEEEFWVHYEERYRSLFREATKFIESTGGPGNDVLVFISCGFDASEYETTEMSRHGRHVPTSFYHKFTLEACAFANKYAGGRLVSVLEGGYSDRALTSGVMSHLAGLAEAGGQKISTEWWSSDELNKIEKVTKKRRGRPPKLDHLDWWLRRMQQIFEGINRDAAPAIPPEKTRLFVPPPPPSETQVAQQPDPPVKKRRRPRTKRPLPPPTQMVTRRSKRASPDELDSAPPSGLQGPNKRRRLSTQEREEEEEESTDDDMSVEEPETGLLPLSPPPSSHSSESRAGKQPAFRAPAGTGLPTPEPSAENVTLPRKDVRPSSSAATAPSSSSSSTPVLARIRGFGAALRAGDSGRSTSGSSNHQALPSKDLASLSLNGESMHRATGSRAAGQTKADPRVLVKQLEDLYKRIERVQDTMVQLRGVADQFVAISGAHTARS